MFCFHKYYFQLVDLFDCGYARKQFFSVSTDPALTLAIAFVSLGHYTPPCGDDIVPAKQ